MTWIKWHCFKAKQKSNVFAPIRFGSILCPKDRRHRVGIFAGEITFANPRQKVQLQRNLVIVVSSSRARVIFFPLFTDACADFVIGGISREFVRRLVGTALFPRYRYDFAAERAEYKNKKVKRDVGRGTGDHRAKNSRTRINNVNAIKR